MNRPSLFGVSNPFAIILFATVISLIVGFGLRTFFASPELKAKIVDSLEQSLPDATSDLGQIQLVLSNGLLPTVSLKVSEFSIQWSQGCMGGSELKGLNVLVPMRLTAVLLGPPNWGRIRSELIQLRLSEKSKECMASRSSADWHDQPIQLASQNTATESVDQGKLGPKINLRPAFELSRAITGISIKRLLIDYRSKQLAELNQVSFRVWPEGLELELIANVDQSVTFEERLPAVKLDLSASKDEMELQLDGRWREGIVGIETLYDIKNDVIDLDLAFKHIPVAPVTAVFKRLEVLEREFLSNSMWSTCVMSVRGPSDGLDSEQWKLHKCELVGEAAELTVENVTFVPKTGFFDPFVIGVNKLDILETMKALGHQHPTKSLGRLGNLSGKLDVRSPKDVRFSGMWNQLELIFSNRGFRQTQVIEEFRLELQRHGDLMKLNASELKLQEGLSEGMIGADIQVENGSADVKVQLGSVQLSPRVQKLMLSGETAPMSFRGEMAWRDQELSAAKMHIEVPKVAGDEINLSNGRFEINKVDRDWLVATDIDTIEFSSATQAHKIMRQFIPAVEDNSALSVSGLLGRMKINGNLMQWERLEGKVGSNQLTSRGGWNEDGELYGNVQVRSPHGRQSLALRGSRSNPLFSGVSAE